MLALGLVLFQHAQRQVDLRQHFEVLVFENVDEQTREQRVGLQCGQCIFQFLTTTVADSDAAVVLAEIHPELVVNVGLHVFNLVGGAQVAFAQQEGEIGVVGF
ncbi:hypothetical protein D3C71_1841110 [compost metagenome]